MYRPKNLPIDCRFHFALQCEYSYFYLKLEPLNYYYFGYRNFYIYLDTSTRRGSPLISFLVLTDENKIYYSAIYDRNKMIIDFDKYYKYIRVSPGSRGPPYEFSIMSKKTNKVIYKNNLSTIVNFFPISDYYLPWYYSKEWVRIV